MSKTGQIEITTSDVEPGAVVLSFPVRPENIVRNGDGTCSFVYTLKGDALIAFMSAFPRLTPAIVQDMLAAARHDLDDPRYPFET